MSLFETYLTARRNEYQGRLMRVEEEVARTSKHNSRRRRDFIRLAALYRDMLALLDRHEAP